MPPPPLFFYFNLKSKVTFSSDVFLLSVSVEPPAVGSDLEDFFGGPEQQKLFEDFKLKNILIPRETV